MSSLLGVIRPKFMKSALLTGEVIARPCILPQRLIEARAKVFDPRTCEDIAIGSRRALYGILSFFNLKTPHKAIFPCRDRLRADSLIGSNATLYRALQDLEVKGYIEREQIRHKHNGKFYLSPISLTEKCLELLGLNNSEKVIHSPPSTTMRDGQYIEHPKEEKQSNKKSIREEVSNSSIDPETKLPKPLLPLIKAGLSKSAICWLMGLAKLSGKRLEDVMNVCLHRLSHITTAREKTAYLRSLISKPRDFTRQADELAKAKTDQQLSDEVAEKLRGIGQRHDGLLLEIGGKVIGIYEHGGQSIRSGQRYAPMNGQLMKIAIQKGFRWIVGRDGDLTD